MIARLHVQTLFLNLCRALALVAVILALKVWLDRPSNPAQPSPMNVVPAQLHAQIESLSDVIAFKYRS